MLFLYYRLNLEGARIKDFQSSKTKSILRLRAQYSGGLAIKKGVCQKVSSRYFDEGLELVDVLTKEYIEDACLKIADGSADNGSTGSLNNYFIYFLDEYIDYVHNEENANLIKYLTSDLYITIYYEMTFVFNLSWEITHILLAKDLQNLFNTINNNTISYQLAEILLFITYIVMFVFLVFYSQNNNIASFENIVEKLSYVMVN